MPLQTDLREVVFALSDALDLVGIDDLAHGKRVGLIAAACVRTLGLPSEEADLCLDLGLLHDVGVSSTRVHGHLVTEFDWSGCQAHALLGHDLLASFPPLAHLALPVKFHHTRWDHLAAEGLAPEVARRANLTFLADRVDALGAAHLAGGTLLQHTEEIRATVAAHAGTYFDPALVAAFLETSVPEAFWLGLEDRSVHVSLGTALTRRAPRPLTPAELKQLALIFSRIVDAKSPFTAEHSMGVGRVARHLGERLGLGVDTCDQLEVAGLLHDLGKLRVPDEVLEKPAKLSAAERRLMDSHSYETWRILSPIPGFQDLARWAASHHEEPDGSGYPFHTKAADMPLEARILRVADILQAMAQDRPYRPGLAAEAIGRFLQDLVVRDRVDPAVAATALADLPATVALAHTRRNPRAD